MEHSLTVIATDSAAPPSLRQLDFTRVIVHVTDLNDNAPEVTSSAGSGAAAAEVSEDAEVGTTVMELWVTDADSELAGEVDECRVNDNDEQTHDSAAPPLPFSLRR